MITEDYVSFETAKLLKEKGFDTVSHYHYDKDGDLLFTTFSVNNALYTSNVVAPTLQIAMKWLREVHDMYIKVSPDINDSYNFYCDVYTKGSESWDNQNVELGDFSTYEQAAEAAIKYCLNLI